MIVYTIYFSQYTTEQIEINAHKMRIRWIMNNKSVPNDIFKLWVKQIFYVSYVNDILIGSLRI